MTALLCTSWKARTIPKITNDRAVTTFPMPIIVQFHTLFAFREQSMEELENILVESHPTISD